MRRLKVDPRENWQDIARSKGFNFHHVNGDLYWDESVCYAFSLREIEEDLEGPAQELADMCLDLVAEAVESERILEQLAIPPHFWDMTRDSWRRNEPSLYGRFDFGYDGKGPAKLYEYNADTPTSLYEGAYFQWLWLEDAIRQGILPAQADQFNSIQEALIETFGLFQVDGLLHLASVKGTEEDRATVEYLRDCAVQAGLDTKQIYMEDILADSQGQFMDADQEPIYWLFKLYPWECMLGDDFGLLLPGCDTTFVEPPWKMILSNKGLLPLLWERHRGHPNLLPAWFHKPGQTPLSDSYVIKPLFSREGANIRVINHGEEIFSSPGEYGKEGHIAQALHYPPNFEGQGPVLGLWIVNNNSRGLSIREDSSPITGDLSRFVPHCILEDG